MAHRRAAARSHGWVRWLAVPAALLLDAAAAAYLAGNQTPFGVAVPESLLVVAPLVVYGALAALVLRTRSPGTRLAAAAILLGIHVALIALHTACYVALWSLPLPAAIRLAHRWSPLIPLLQLISVPLLALPFLAMTRREAPPAPRRSAALPSRRDVLATRASRTGLRAPVQPGRDVRFGPEPTGLLPEVPPPVPPVTHVEVSPPVVVEALSDEPPVPQPEPVPIPAARPVPAMSPVAHVEVSPPVVVEALSEEPPVLQPEPVPIPAARPLSGKPPAASVPPPVAVPPPQDNVADASPAPLPAPVAALTPPTMAPAPVWFDQLVASEEERPRDDQTAVPAAPSQGEVRQGPEVSRVAHVPEVPPVPTLVQPLALAPAPPAVLAPAPEPVAPPCVSTTDTRDDARTLPRAVEPPVDPYLVARLFEPYGPLLSRDRTVLVDWTPGPDAGVLCAAPRGVFRDQAVSLGARLAHVIDVGALPSVAGPIRRLSLGGSDGAVVITPLDGAVLVAAARRRGALALLEVLSGRAVPGPISGEPDAASASATSAATDASVSGATRVESGVAIVDVLTPDGIQAPPMGELAGRLLAVILAPGGPALESLTVELGSHRLMIHPVQPDARPPRFVGVVSGRELPGLLGRRTERAARALREAS
jgi:hypothetical protein